MLKHGDVVVEGRWNTKLSIKVYHCYGSRRIYDGDTFNAGYCIRGCEGCEPSNSIKGTLHIDDNYIYVSCPAGKHLYNECIHTFISDSSRGRYKIRQITNADLPITKKISWLGIKYIVDDVRRVFVPYRRPYAYRFRMDPAPSGCGHGGAIYNHAHTGKGLLVGAYKKHWDEQVASYDDDTDPMYFIHRHSKSIYRESGLDCFDWPCEHRRRQKRAWKRNKIRSQWMKNHPDKNTTRIDIDYTINDDNYDNMDMAA